MLIYYETDLIFIQSLFVEFRSATHTGSLLLLLLLLLLFLLWSIDVSCYGRHLDYVVKVLPGGIWQCSSQVWYDCRPS